jgi:hypothetical protein
MKKHKILVALLSIALICTACDRENEYKDIIYYKAIGVGYVFTCDSKSCYPLQGAKVNVTAHNGTGGLFGISYPVTETYTTDAQGCYKVRFVKSVSGETYIPGKGVFYTHTYFFKCENEIFTLDVENVKNVQGIILLDTIKF